MKIHLASDKDSDSVGTLIFELMTELSAPKPLMVSREKVIFYQQNGFLLLGPRLKYPLVPSR